MSGFSYLKGLRKSELTEFAELTSLPSYDLMKKPELESALDEHLKANQSAYSGNSALRAYYNRLAPRSPAKRGSTTGVDEPAKKPRQRGRPSQVALEEGVTSDAETPTSSKIKDINKTPSRQLSQRVRLPPSPAVVSDKIERTTNRIRAQVAHYFDRPGITETHDSVRKYFSQSIIIVYGIPAILEAYRLREVILPSKPIGKIPSFQYSNNDEYTVNVPDLFLLLTQKFWAPFSLWAATSLIVPLTFAYFFNFALYAQPTRSSCRTESSSSAPQYDPIVFSITKALASYLVYAQHWVPFHLFQNHTVATVNEGVYGGYQGMITAAAIGGVIGLYDTILKK